MSADTEADFDIMAEVERVSAGLNRFSWVTGVDARVKNGPKGQYVSFAVRAQPGVDNIDIKVNNELATYLDNLWGSREEWWIANDAPGCACTVNSYGLCPSPEKYTGSFSL